MIEAPTPYRPWLYGFWPFDHVSQTAPSISCKFFHRATFCGSLWESETQEVSRAFVARLIDAVCYTAKWLKSSALRRQGYTYAEIARMVGRDPRTVKRYLTEGAQPLYRRQKPSPSKLDPFKQTVQAWLEKEPTLRATRIHQDLSRDYGFDGGYQIVQRYVRALRAAKDPRVEYEERFESAPGYQAQVDWSYEEPIITSGGLAAPLYCFHMVLEAWPKTRAPSVAIGSRTHGEPQTERGHVRS